MGILGGGGGSGNFERLLESATSHLQLEPNWAIILEVCDSIRQKDVTAKLAVSLIRKRIKDVNPHISKLALVTLEACMKNCGEPVHDEVATRDCMDELRVLATSGSGPVKEQILSMVQTWNQTLGKKASYRVIQDTYNVLKAEGHAFPQLNESDAMYLAETAPEWAEGDTCHQCRVKFSTFTRQHHCRCCGQVFCAKCSSKSSIIPKYGIEREVRVCDPCYDSINPAGGEKPSVASKDTQSVESDGLPAEYLNSSLAKEAQTKPKPSEAEIKAQEEEELQLAMALSLSAADADQQQQPKRNWSSPAETPYSSPPSAPSSLYPEPKSNLYTDVVTDSKKVSDSSDAELSHYLNRDYWEKRKDGRSTEPSAPVVHEVEDVLPRGSTYQSVEEEDREDVGENSSAFVKTFSNSIEMFMNRIQTVKSKGKHIAMDSTVQNLFQSLSAMHPQLMKLIEDEEDNKAKYQAMLQKIALVREARESLDNMRNQHREKLSQQELEQEMLRRMQMEQKLELMRQQKQEYLEYQRQLQIQRQQEIEQQQHLKLQQKQFLERQYGYRGNGEYEAVADGYRGGSGYQSMPVNPDQAMSPAHMMQYQQQQQQQPQQQQQQQQPQQQAGNQFIQQQNQGYQRSEQMAQDPSIPGQQVPQRHPLPQTQPASKAPSAGYMPQGQPMSPQPQAASYSQAQPQVPGSPYQKPQQPTQYPTSVPDLLDAPIGNDLGQQQQQPPQQQQRESQPQGYHNQQFHQHIPQQYQPNQRLSPHQQRFQPQAQQPGGIHQQQGGVPQQVVGIQQPPTGVQQQPGSIQQQPINLPSSISQPPGSSQQQQGGIRQQQPGMHQQPVLQQQSGSMSMPGGGPQQMGGIQQQQAGIQQPPTGGMQQQPSMQPAIGGMLQQAGGQQQPSGVMQQPGMQQQQQHSGLPQQQQAGNMQQQSYPQSVPHTAQAAPNSSYPGQQQQQLYQESNSYPSQYPTQQLPQSQQGPASLPYRQTQSNQAMHGPASLPASLNQYPKGHDTDAGYSPGPQQNAYGQQPQQQAPEPQFSESMKDLQLISFE